MYWETISSELNKIGDLSWQHFGSTMNGSWKVSLTPRPPHLNPVILRYQYIDHGSTAPNALIALWDQFNKMGMLPARIDLSESSDLGDCHYVDTGIRFNSRWEYQVPSDLTWKPYRFRQASDAG